MKVTIQVGSVTVQASGLDITPRQIKSLLISCASIALSLTGEPEPEPEERTPIGFSAHLERAPDVVEDFSEYFEE